MIKIGILGSGKVAERHLLAYRRLPVDVVIADTLEEVARQTAHQYGVGFRQHPDDILSDDSVTAVDICVPTIHHKDLIIKSLGSGKHVFCEKPLCPTLTDARAIEEVVNKSQRILMVGYLQRFHPAFSFVKGALSDGIIGNPNFATFRVGGRGDDQPWKHQRANGGGVILEMLVHKLDQIVWMFGPADTVDVLLYDTVMHKRRIRTQIVDSDAEDLVVLDIRVGDVRILCHGDFLTPSYMDTMEVQGDNGSIFSSLLHYLPTIIYCREPRNIFNVGNNTYNFPMVNLFELELRHFVDSINDYNRDNMNSLESSIHVLEIIEEINRYAENIGDPRN